MPENNYNNDKLKTNFKGQWLILHSFASTLCELKLNPRVRLMNSMGVFSSLCILCFCIFAMESSIFEVLNVD